ncbi:hypothetical protein L580_3310 [Serratia fonticola AU-P3(3)]|nr:hypothetical protein L580_3310 [Serratia fonticola AU-P3(3)]
MSKNRMLILLCSMFLAFPAYAANNKLTQKIDQNINEYLDAVLSSSGSDIYVYVMAFATFLMFVCAVGEILKFIMGEPDWVAAFTLIILWFITMALISSYGMVTSTIKYAFGELADTFQYLTIGNKDPMFLSTFIDNVIGKAIQAPDTGITDTIFMWAITIVWAILSIILQAAFYLTDVYITLGLALAQMVGVLFIPFLIAPWTRSIFDGWVRFFIGWGVFGLVLRITCLLTMLVMKATINAAGSFDFTIPNVTNTDLINANYEVIRPLIITDANLELLIAIIIFGFISCLMIFSAFSFAKALSSGVGSASDAANGAAKKMAATAAKMLI